MNYQFILIISYYSDTLCHQINKTEILKKIIDCDYGVIVIDCITDYTKSTFNKTLEMNKCYNGTLQSEGNHTSLKLEYKNESIDIINYFVLIFIIAILFSIICIWAYYECQYCKICKIQTSRRRYRINNSNSRLYGTP